MIEVDDFFSEGGAVVDTMNDIFEDARTRIPSDLRDNDEVVIGAIATQINVAPDSKAITQAEAAIARISLYSKRGMNPDESAFSIVEDQAERQRFFEEGLLPSLQSAGDKLDRWIGEDAAYAIGLGLTGTEASVRIIDTSDPRVSITSTEFRVIFDGGREVTFEKFPIGSSLYRPKVQPQEIVHSVVIDESRRRDAVYVQPGPRRDTMFDWYQGPRDENEIRQAVEDDEHAGIALRFAALQASEEALMLGHGVPIKPDGAAQWVTRGIEEAVVKASRLQFEGTDFKDIEPVDIANAIVACSPGGVSAQSAFISSVHDAFRSSLRTMEDVAGNYGSKERLNEILSALSSAARVQSLRSTSFPVSATNSN